MNVDQPELLIHQFVSQFSMTERSLFLPGMDLCVPHAPQNLFSGATPRSSMELARGLANFLAFSWNWCADSAADLGNPAASEADTHA